LTSRNLIFPPKAGKPEEASPYGCLTNEIKVTWFSVQWSEATYDFGSTTILKLKIVSAFNGKKGKSKIARKKYSADY